MIKLASKEERNEIRDTVINITQHFTKNYSDIIDFKPCVNMNALLNSIYFRTRDTEDTMIPTTDFTSDDSDISVQNDGYFKDARLNRYIKELQNYFGTEQHLDFDFSLKLPTRIVLEDDNKFYPLLAEFNDGWFQFYGVQNKTFINVYLELEDNNKVKVSAYGHSLFDCMYDDNSTYSEVVKKYLERLLPYAGVRFDKVIKKEDEVFIKVVKEEDYSEE